MKKAVPYILLPIAYSFLAAHLSWCAISACGALINLSGGGRRVLVTALLTAPLSLTGLVALLIYNHGMLKEAPFPVLAKWTEASLCALLYMPFMAMLEPIVGAAARAMW